MKKSNLAKLNVTTATASQGLFQPEIVRVDVLPDYQSLPSAANDVQESRRNYNYCHAYGCLLITGACVGVSGLLADTDSNNDESAFIYGGVMLLLGAGLCALGSYVQRQAEDTLARPGV